MTTAISTSDLPKLEDLPIHLFRPNDHLLAFLKNGVRPDGRSLHHSRPFTLAHNVVQGKHIISSSQCVLGGTMVMSALTLKVGMPSVSQPRHGDVGKHSTLCPFSPSFSTKKIS